MQGTSLPEYDETHLFSLLVLTGSLVVFRCVDFWGVGDTVMTHFPVRGL